MTNIELFKYSGKHPEPALDPYYNRNKIVIPPTIKESNALVEANTRLINLISAFSFFVERGKGKHHSDVQAIVKEVVDILQNTKSINLSPFTQFFMVYNSSYSLFEQYNDDEKKEFIYNILQLYVKERHKMYLSHGYSNSILQVVCDNYAHKRTATTTTLKVCNILDEVGFSEKPYDNGDMLTRSYFSLDKGRSGKRSFKNFKKHYDLVMTHAKNAQDKLPDMVFAIDGEYYIVEMKMMKDIGGGQDKQASEVIDFIKYSEPNEHIHYLVYLDGEYSNLLHQVSPSCCNNIKIKRQYEDIVSSLKNNPGNYFLNTAGLKKLITEIAK